MKIKNLRRIDVKNNKNINSSFLSVNLDNIKINCKIYKGNFFADSFSYFPITTDYNTFQYMYNWRNKLEYNHYYTKKFSLKFEKEKNNFKFFKNLFVLGSSPGDNYYRNLITFIPRIFFITGEEVSVAIHRKTSNKFRKFIQNILETKKIKLKKFVYLDDELYHFKDSLIPQFFPLETGIKVMNQVLKKNNAKKNKIYLTRKNSFYRKIINESDLIDVMKSKNFNIVDLETLSINEQINVFTSADVVVSATSSGLANIIFCNKGAKVYEITPKYKFNYENILKTRYSEICKILGHKYFSMSADPVQVNNIDSKTKQFVSSKVINQSNYYKNLIIKKDDFNKFISLI